MKEYSAQSNTILRTYYQGCFLCEKETWQIMIPTPDGFGACAFCSVCGISLGEGQNIKEKINQK